jgi:hypothetical protein
MVFVNSTITSARQAKGKDTKSQGPSENGIHRGNCIAKLLHGSKKEQKAARTFVDKHFTMLYENGVISNIKQAKVVNMILMSDQIAADEQTSLDAAMAWARCKASAHGSDPNTVLASVISSVRLPLLSLEQLSTVSTTGAVPQDHLLELFTYISLGEISDRKLPPDFPYSTTSRKGSMDLKYTGHWDMKGFFSYIGTNGFTTSWTNPYLSDRVDIETTSDGTFNSSSSIYPLPHGSGNTPKEVTSWIIDQQNMSSTCCSSTAAAWFIVDCKKYRLRPNRITVRQNYDGNYIYGWTLSASNDKSSWVNLVSNSGSGSAKELMETFEAPAEYFRYFKIHKPSSQVLLSGWEMYGQIKIASQ